MPKIATLDDYQNVALRFADWSRLPSGWELTVFNDHLESEDAVAARLKDFEIVLIIRERTPFPRSLMEKLPNLKMIANTGMLNASVEMGAATERGILVCGTQGGMGATWELAWGLMISVMRGIHTEYVKTLAGAWQTQVGPGLAGKTLGLIGLGKIGGRMAEIARAFGMRPIAWSENLTDARAAEVGAERVTLETLLGDADIVSLHTRLSDRTKGLLGQRELGLMKPHAFLINTSRGPIVEEAALVATLKAGAIAGAALDVFDQEPLPPGHPFRSLENVLLSPHMGYVAVEVYQKYYGESLENILAYLAGKPERVLNPDVLPRLTEILPTR